MHFQKGPRRIYDSPREVYGLILGYSKENTQSVSKGKARFKKGHDRYVASSDIREMKNQSHSKGDATSHPLGWV